MTEPTFTMTASHLARAMEQARARERERIARYLDGQAGRAHEGANVEMAQALLEAAEYVRSSNAPPAAPAEADPLDALSDSPPPGDELPPVRHMDDFDEGVGMVRNLAGRGRLHL